MTNRSPREAELLRKATSYLPGGTAGNTSFSDDLQFLVKEGKGSHIWDVSGNQYSDWMMGSGPMILGHAHPAVTEAVIDAVRHGSTFFATNENAVLLAEELIRAVPCAEKVRFTTSGTDACFQAMRAARAYTGKDKILKFEGGFHGTSDYAVMSVTPSAANEYPQATANMGGVPKVIEDLVLVSQYNDLATTQSLIESHHDELAAVIVEPLQRVISPMPGFLQGLRELTETYNIPLIFDEVVTGFRLSYGGAQGHYGVTPDLCSVGKIMGGGYALAAVMGKADIMSVYSQSEVSSDDYVNQIGTLNGNPIACAAGLATLDQLKQPGAYEKLRKTGKTIRDALVSICADNSIPVQSSGDDTIFDIFFSESPVTNYRQGLLADSQTMNKFNTELLRHGILKSWPQKYYPSLAHTDDDISQTIQAFKEIVPSLRS